MKKFIIIILSLFFTSTYSAEINKPSSAYDLYKLSLLSDAAFAENDFDGALKSFSIVDRNIGKYPKAKKWIQYYFYKIPQLEMIQKARRLQNKKSEIVHRFLVIYVKNTKIDSKTLKGKPLIASNSITNEQIKKVEIAQNIFKHYIKVLTYGKVGVQFKRIIIDSSITEITKKIGYDYEDKEYDLYGSVLSSIQPYPEDILFNNINKFDSIIFYWNDKGISARPTGTFNHVPLVPYQLIGAKRGIIQFPIGYTNAGTILHEFFHTLEQNFAVKPGHGFLNKNRKYFKNWKGKGQYSYYKYHFDSTMMKKGYPFFDYKKTFPDYLTRNVIYKNKNLIKSISLKNLKKGYQAYLNAKSVWTKNPKKALSTLQKAYKYNKYYSETLALYGRYEYDNKNVLKAKKYLEKSLLINPYVSSTHVWLGIVYRKEKKSGLAIEKFNRAIELDPFSASAYFHRGFSYYALKKIDKSINDYIRCVELSHYYKKSVVNFYKKLSKNDKINAPRIIDAVKGL